MCRHECCVYMCICICAGMCMYIAFMYICICACVYMCAYVCMHLLLCIYVCVCHACLTCSRNSISLFPPSLISISCAPTPLGSNVWVTFLEKLPLD